MAQKCASNPPPMEKPVESETVKGVGLADLCIKRPVFATMINLLLVLISCFAYQRIGIYQLPYVELHMTTDTTTLTSPSPDGIESSITKPLRVIINRS